MGSGIQATFSLRTFHDAHTAGVGQQVADYVAGVCVYARVGCQQNTLIVRSQSKRMESYAGIRHTLQLSMVFGSMVCDASETACRFTTLLQQLGFVGMIDILNNYLKGVGGGSPD
jgi:hypothetical protein